MNLPRRSFLRSTVGAFAVASLVDQWPNRLAAAQRQTRGQSAEQTADNEHFWFQVQQAFDVDRSLINLNNGGCCPSPRVVMDALRRQIEYTNNVPTRHLW